MQISLPKYHVESLVLPLQESAIVLRETTLENLMNQENKTFIKSVTGTCGMYLLMLQTLLSTVLNTHLHMTLTLAFFYPTLTFDYPEMKSSLTLGAIQILGKRPSINGFQIF